MSDDSTTESDSKGSDERQDRAASGAPATGWAVPNRFSADEIFERVLASAEQEITADKHRLFFSGLTAGFAIVLTFLGHAVGAEIFPDNRFLSALLYPIGFIYIIMGHYQLYTENTLPPVALVLSRYASVPLLLRVWGIVLVGNVVAAGFGTFLVVQGHVLSPEAMRAGAEFTKSGLEHGWWSVFNRSLFAGWLVAGVVWLDHTAQDTISRLIMIYIIFYMIAAAELYHVITAASDAIFFLLVTEAGVLTVLRGFWLPIFLGNTVGGVFLFTLVNHAQTEQQHFPEVQELSVRELLFSWRGGFKIPGSRESADTDSGTDAE